MNLTMRVFPALRRLRQRLTRTALPAAAASVASLALASAAAAATYTVSDTSDYPLEGSGPACVSTDSAHSHACTLRAAVQAADKVSGASTITLAAGDYKLEIPSTSTNEPANGDLDINGSATSVTITGAGASSTIIDANHLDRAFAVQSGKALTVSGVTVRNGSSISSAASSDPGEGGAFLNLGSLTIENSVLSGNSASSNAGVVASESVATATSIVNSTVERNSANGDGGVLNVHSGSVALSGDTIAYNTADSYGGVLDYELTGSAGPVTVSGSTISHDTSYYYGGALYVYRTGTMTITNSTLEDDRSYEYGGAITNYESGLLTVSGSTFTNDNAGVGDGGAIYAYLSNLAVSESRFHGDDGEYGGAIYLLGSSNTVTESITASSFAEDYAPYEGGAIDDYEGNLQLSANTFSADVSQYGGALYVEGNEGGLAATNDTFDGNQAAYAGGAIYLTGAPGIGELILLNDTITRNLSYEGGGIFDPQHANAIENTIVAGNFGASTTKGGGDCYASKVLDNAESKDKGGNIDGDGSCFSNSVSGDQAAANPLLGELASNGGPTETDGLLPGSPAIAHGVSTPLACPAGDERGSTRSGSCYVGAFQGVIEPAAPSNGGGSSSGSTVSTSTTSTVSAVRKVARKAHAQCKSTRTELLSWKLSSGVRLKRIVVRRDGKIYRTLSGGARRVSVSMVGLPKGIVRVSVTGTTASGLRYTMSQRLHLCVPGRGARRAPSDYLKPA